MSEGDTLTAADVDQIIDGIEEFIIEGLPGVRMIWQPYIRKLRVLKNHLAPAPVVETRPAVPFKPLNLGALHAVVDPASPKSPDYGDRFVARLMADDSDAGRLIYPEWLRDRCFVCGETENGGWHVLNPEPAVTGPARRAYHPFQPIGAATLTRRALPRVQSNPLSAQPCGCDPGANWVCRVHQQEENRRHETS